MLVLSLDAHDGRDITKALSYRQAPRAFHRRYLLRV